MHGTVHMSVLAEIRHKAKAQRHVLLRVFVLAVARQLGTKEGLFRLFRLAERCGMEPERLRSLFEEEEGFLPSLKKMGLILPEDQKRLLERCAKKKASLPRGAKSWQVARGLHISNEQARRLLIALYERKKRAQGRPAA